MWIALNQNDVSYVWTYLAGFATLGLALFAVWIISLAVARPAEELADETLFAEAQGAGRLAGRAGRSPAAPSPPRETPARRRPHAGDCRSSVDAARHPPARDRPDPAAARRRARRGTRTRSTRTTSGSRSPRPQIGAFLYIRYQPAFPLCQGGVVDLPRAPTTSTPIDIEHLDYEMTMPWPEVDGNTITTANGLRIEFLEPGRVARVTYDSGDGTTSFDVDARPRSRRCSSAGTSCPARRTTTTIPVASPAAASSSCTAPAS